STPAARARPSSDTCVLLYWLELLAPSRWYEAIRPGECAMRCARARAPREIVLHEGNAHPKEALVDEVEGRAPGRRALLMSALTSTVGQAAAQPTNRAGRSAMRPRTTLDRGTEQAGRSPRDCRVATRPRPVLPTPESPG